MSFKLLNEQIIYIRDVYALQVMQRSYKAKKVLKWCTCLLSLGLFLLIYKASLSLRSIALLAVSRIIKQEDVYKLLQEGDSDKCFKICEFLSLILCSLNLVE